MPSIKIKYFAMFRELAGKDSEDFLFEGSYGELYENIAHKYSFNLPQEMIQVAVNDEFTHLNRLVEDGGRVVFIPPVAGG